MTVILITILIESIIFCLLSFFIHGVWKFFIPILSLFIIYSSCAYIRVNKRIANAFKKKRPEGFNDQEIEFLLYCPGITFPRAKHGFRALEITISSGWIQILLVLNLILSLFRMDIFSILITLVLLYFACFTYSSQIPGASPEDDLKRIYNVREHRRENMLKKHHMPMESNSQHYLMRVFFDIEVEKYVELIRKLREYLLNRSQSM